MTDMGLSTNPKAVRKREWRAKRRAELLPLVGSGYEITKAGVVKRTRLEYVRDMNGPLKETLTAARAWPELLAGRQFDDQPGAD